MTPGAAQRGPWNLPSVAFVPPARRPWIAVPLGLCLALLGPGAALPADTQAPSAATARLEHSRLPAQDEQRTLLRVDDFGRFAITARSPRGTALRLVDRMAGPGELAGSPGSADGRLDLFLDRGEYLLLTSSQKSTNPNEQVELRVHPFTERHASRPVLLPQETVVSTELRDFESASYWLEISSRQWVALEAAGRHLADLRLWQDGTWLVDAEPEREVLTPAVGRPLLACRLAVELEPGLYRLSAYGGAGQPWADDDGTRPLHLRFNTPRLAEAGRQRFTVSPFGVDRYLVPGKATYFRLELPAATIAQLDVGGFTHQQPFRAAYYQGVIDKTSVPPATELMVEPLEDGQLHLVSVAAPAGQPYVLQHFELRDSYPFSGSGRYWLSTVHSGPPGDAIDATGLVARWQPGQGLDAHPFLSQVVEVGTTTAWARRCNLLDPLTLFVHVATAGSYEVLAQGPEARFRFEPFLIEPPEGYQPPPFRGSGSTWELDAGYYVLAVEPLERGILDLAVRPQGMLASLVDLLGLRGGTQPGPTRAALRFGVVELEENHGYTLYRNWQPEVQAGVVLRKVPLDLSDALPLAQQPGEGMLVPFTSAEPGQLEARAEDGSLLEISVDGGPWQTQPAVAIGSFAARVRVSGEQTVLYSLVQVPDRLRAGHPLPELPAETLAALPDFPVLTDGAPHFLDLEHNASSTFLVRAERPALYHLESTGLLYTEGNLRSRVVTSLDRQEGNGVGRNFLVQQYLREGDYQLTVAARDRSAGHLGVQLRRTPLLDGGELALGVPARRTLGVGEAVVYRFRVATAGDYRLRALGLARTLRCRLEDGAGWPLAAPNLEADLTRRFEPGEYRLVLLPEAVPGRSVTYFEALPEPPRFAGHGPHPLALDRPVQHWWQESMESEQRPPDVWQLTVPADLTATISLDAEMIADVLHRQGDGSWQPVAFVPPGRPWRGPLAAGEYRLEARCLRRNNQVWYQLQVTPEELVAGLSRELAAPAEIALAVGQPALVQLSSTGGADVRARLYDAAGRLLASHDDLAEDWNFQLATPLAPGRYRLRVDPVGSDGASTRVAMSLPEERSGDPLEAAATVRVELDRRMLLLPLRLPAEATLLLAGAEAEQTLGLALEGEVGGVWRTLASDEGRRPRLQLALASGAPAPAAWRLRLWSPDQRPGPVQLGVAALSPPSEREARAGAEEKSGGQNLRLAPVPGLTGSLTARAGALEPRRPGSFRLQPGSAGLFACAHPHQPCLAAQDGLVAAGDGPLYLVQWGGGDAAVQLRRLQLKAGEDAARVLTLPGLDGPAAPPQPVTFDLEAGPASHAGGPVLVLARSLAGQPAVQVAEAEGAASPPVLGLGSGAAAAVSLAPEQPVARAWSTVEQTLSDVRLSQLRYRPVPAEPPFWGNLEGGLAGVAARAFQLPPGGKRLRLALGSKLVAVLSAGDQVLSVHWDGDTPCEETVETAADRLTLLHTGEGAHRFAVEVLPLAPERSDIARLGPAQPFAERASRRGQRYLEVDAARGVLEVRGSDGDALLVEASGHVRRGQRFELHGQAASLRIPHGSGLVLAWLEDERPPSAGSWFAAGAPPAQPVRAPAVIPLAGPAQTLIVELDHPAMLHLRASQPGLTLTRDASGSERLQIHPDAIAVDAYFGAGRSELWLRGLAGELTGSAELTTTAVTPLGEGLGPEVLLSAGGTRVFAFTVAADGSALPVPIGLGVRADSDVVEARLLDASGRELGRGVVQMPSLAPGHYLLALSVPPDAGPVRARAAVVGLERPSTGPPPDVIRSYLVPEEEEP